VKQQLSEFTALVKKLAIAGNLIFILWILYNGINENFEGTMPEKVSYITLMGLLAANSFFLMKKPVEK